MKTDQLIPRAPRRKKQPTADQMRAALAAAVNVGLGAVHHFIGAGRLR